MDATASPHPTPTPSRRGKRVRLFAPALAGLLVGFSAIAPAAGTTAANPSPGARPLASIGVELLTSLRGTSGKLLAAFRAPGEPLIQPLPPGLRVRFEPDRREAMPAPPVEDPQHPGVYRIAVEVEQARHAVADLRLITLVPFAAKSRGRIGSYRLGDWPFERGGAPSPAYANPAGFVEVTPENRNLPVSPHFRLGDFLTKDQADVWPKYVLIDPRLIDKLELVIQELEDGGHPVAHMAVMSGFRTPGYNRAGETSGRARLSRHMYGDATDVFVDNDRDGWTDDLNRDGRVDIHDAELIARVAERVEARHPALSGGIGIYAATRAHGPFTHIDVRGRPARWRGAGAD
jgi:hypothetical protein